VDGSLGGAEQAVMAPEEEEEKTRKKTKKDKKDKKGKKDRTKDKGQQNDVGHKRKRDGECSAVPVLPPPPSAALAQALASGSTSEMPTTSASAAQRLLSRKTKGAMGGFLNEEVASKPSESDFGRRMLAKFGWKEGQGLGKNGTGMAEHIRVKRREDGVGLGADKKPSDNMWAAPPMASAAGGCSSDDEDDGSIDGGATQRSGGSAGGVVPGLSDQDLFKACGGVRLGMRAHAGASGQSGKLRRMQEADRRLMEAAAGTSVVAAAGGVSLAAANMAEKMAQKMAAKAAEQAERRVAKKARAAA
jgi:hypothetical protein